MIHRFRPHLEILPPAQTALWHRLAPLSTLGFVLYGGTAIALRLGHRQSVDFDFFNDQPLDRSALYKSMPVLQTAQVIQDEPDTLTALVSTGDPGRESVKISFFCGIDFGRVGEPEVTEDGTTEVASLDDLLATKLKVMLQRVEVRDYRDVVALLAAGVELGRGLAAARSLFGRSFQPSESLKALTYFAGGNVSTLDSGARAALVDAARAIQELPDVSIRSRRLSGGSSH